jgi:TRAP-type C4-dicarboxylate transport system permease small subunit
MFWLALLGASGALWSGHHIGLRLVVERLPSKARGLAQVVTELAIGVFAVLLMIQGLELVARTSGGDWSALRIPLGYTYVVLPLSAALMALLSFMKGTLRAISIFRGGEIPPNWSTDQEEL